MADPSDVAAYQHSVEGDAEGLVTLVFAVLLIVGTWWFVDAISSRRKLAKKSVEDVSKEDGAR